MEVNNKYNLGDELYTVVRKPIKYGCPVCDGSGVFMHNGYNVKCPHCYGIGKLQDNKTLWCVADEKVVVRRIIVSIWKDQTTCKYKVNYSGSDCNINNRGEDNLYWNKEDAEAWCLKNNNPIHDIDTDGTIHAEEPRKPCRIDYKKPHR